MNLPVPLFPLRYKRFGLHTTTATFSGSLLHSRCRARPFFFLLAGRFSFPRVPCSALLCEYTYLCLCVTHQCRYLQTKNSPPAYTLKGVTTESSHQPPQAQQQGNPSSEAFEQIPLLAAGAMEQPEGGVAGAEGNKNQAANSNGNSSSLGALYDGNDGQENLAVSGQPAVATSPTKTNSSSAETGPSPRDENEAQEVPRTDGAVVSSEAAHTAGSCEHDPGHSSSERSPLRQSVDGNYETRLPAAEARRGESPEDDDVGSTTPRVGGSESGEEGPGHLAALRDEDHTTSSDNAIGLNDLQPPAGNDPPEHVPSCEASGESPTVEGFHFGSDAGPERVLRVSGDARKLADEAISSSLLAVAAAIRASPRDKRCQPETVAETIRAPTQASSHGVQSTEQIDLEKDASPAESTGKPNAGLPASVRTAVVDNFLAGVYEVASALGAAAAARVPPPAVEEMPKIAVDSAAVVSQQQPVPIDHEDFDQSDGVDKIENHLSPVCNASAPASEPVVELATVVVGGEERTIVSDGVTEDGGKEGETPIDTVPAGDHPSPPSSASLRAAIVQDFISEASETIASEVVATAAEAPPEAAPIKNTPSKKPSPTRDEPADDTIRVDRTGDNAPQESGTSASAREPLVEPAAGGVVGDERPPMDGDETEDGGEGGEKPTDTAPTDEYLSPPSSASLRAAVVQDFMSDMVEAIASQVVAKAVETPPATAPAKTALSEDPASTRDKPADDIFQLDQTEEHALPVPGTSVSDKDSLVEPAAEIVGDEHPPRGGGKIADGEEEDNKPTGAAPTDGQPSLPSSASLRAAVVQDFMFETSQTIASEAAAMAAETPPDTAPVTTTLSEELSPTRNEPTGGIVQLAKPGDHVPPVCNSLVSGKEFSVEPAAEVVVGNERIPVSDGVAADGGGEVEKPTGPVPTDDQPNPPSSASLRAAVVQDFISETSETIASEMAATSAETPPDISPATKTLLEEPAPTRDEPADDTIRVDRTGDAVLPEPGTSTPAREPLVELAAGGVGGDERRPATGGNEVADGEKRIRDSASGLSPPSSASVRGAVVADFLSGTYGAVATTQARAAAVAPSPPNGQASSVPAPTEDDPANGVVELDTPRANTEPSLAVSVAHQSEQQEHRREEQRTAAAQQLESEEPPKQEEVQHQAASQRSLPSDESLRPAVAEDHLLSDTLAGLLPAGGKDEAAAATEQRDQPTPDERRPPSRGEPAAAAAARTATAGCDEQDGGGRREATPEHNAAAVLAVRNSIVEAMAATAEQGSTTPGDSTACTTGGGEGRGAAKAREGLCSPTPPGTPEGKRRGNASPSDDSEVPAEEPNPGVGGHPPSNPRSAEALSYLTEAGARAKSHEEASGNAKGEAAEWLSLAGATARTTQDRADKARADASSWLRDTGARALSSEGTKATDSVPFFAARGPPIFLGGGGRVFLRMFARDYYSMCTQQGRLIFERLDADTLGSSELLDSYSFPLKLTSYLIVTSRYCRHSLALFVILKRTCYVRPLSSPKLPLKTLSSLLLTATLSEDSTSHDCGRDLYSHQNPLNSPTVATRKLSQHIFHKRQQ